MLDWMVIQEWWSLQKLSERKSIVEMTVSRSDVWLLESEEQLQTTGAIVARAVVDVDSGTVPVQITSLGAIVELPKG